MLRLRFFDGHFLGWVRLFCATFAVLSMCGCKKTPEEIIPKEEMAQLMADIHLGEAVIDFNYSAFPNDSAKRLLKQSIYAAHNVTGQQVDTSFVWYGNHIEEYIKVYDRTIEIIQERQHSMAHANAQISVVGDSVHVWNGPQRLAVNVLMPARVLTFDLAPDSTWQKGDVYALSYKQINSSSAIDSRILVDYSDGTTAYANEPDVRSGVSTLKIQVDSMLTPLRVYGYMAFALGRGQAYEVDSIFLTRIRSHLARNAKVNQKLFAYGKHIGNVESLNVDSTTVSVIQEPGSGRPRRTQPLRRYVGGASDENLPQSSSELGRSTEHRRDAPQHKPSQVQRRNVARQHNNNVPRPQKSFKKNQSGSSSQGNGK